MHHRRRASDKENIWCASKQPGNGDLRGCRAEPLHGVGQGGRLQLSKAAAERKKRDAIEAAREIGNRRAFDGVREIELMPGPRRPPRISGILLGLRRRALDIPWAPARSASTNSPLSIHSCRSTDFWACV